MAKKKKTQDDKDMELLRLQVRALTQLKDGRAVLWYILGICDIYSDSFTGNSHTFYAEGKRSVGLDILAMLEDADPRAYINMQHENVKRMEAKNG